MCEGEASARLKMDGTTRIVYIPGVTARRSPGSSGKLFLLAAACAACFSAAVWFGWYWWTNGRFIESTDDAYIGGEVTTLSSKVAGFIETVADVDNQSIKAGDLLVKIDARLPGSSSPIVRGRLPVDCSVLCAFRDDGSSHAEACVTRIPKGAVRIKGGELRRSSQ
jgi:hypothetical protein